MNITLTEAVTSVQVQISLIDNAIHEFNEEFSALLSGASDSSVTIFPSSTTIRILDDDGKVVVKFIPISLIYALLIFILRCCLLLPSADSYVF